MSGVESTERVSGFKGPDRPAEEDLLRCIHCGLCLNHCPTYRLWGMEADSPRGRIRQMLLVDRGELDVDGSFRTHIDRCLDCRACETACPSGVEYGKLVELARAQIGNHGRTFGSRLGRNLVYRHLLGFPRRISAAARLVRFYQRSGLQTLVRSSRVLRLMGLADRDLFLPRVDDEFFFSKLGRTFPAEGKRRARVAFFAGCLAQVTFTALNDATIQVLSANGCDVVVPRDQRCCGALAAHAGEREAARKLARRNLEAFAAAGEFDAVVTNAAGCGSTLKEYPHLFDGEHGDGGQAAAFSAKLRDVTEFLDELGLVAPLEPLPVRVTYQDSCHLAHGQRIREAPRRLLRAIPGLQLHEMERSDQCCGSAGVYNVTEPQASLELLKDKMENAHATEAEIIATANPGCILQLRAGAAIYGTNQEVLHVVELLGRALR